jgi:F-type H+-transporting ATPase subunit gamma
MANLKEIRSRIKSVITTQQMTRAMKMVSAAKLRRAQDHMTRLRPYAGKLREIMNNISSNVQGGIESPYTAVREPNKVLIILVTSNRGLCGAFNANVIKLAAKVIEENYSAQYAAGNLELLCIGKKGFEFFQRRKFNILDKMNHDIFADINPKTSNAVADIVLNGFAAKRWDKVDLIYNEFRNVISQNKVCERFLPVVPDELIKGAPAKASADYIFEPEQEKILEALIPQSLRTQLYKAVLESNAGEQGARMSAMENATTNAEEMLKDLRLTYNRARQATITTEILEIVAGAEALAAK